MEILKLMMKRLSREIGKKLKLKEGKISVLQGVPKSLPALVKASRIQEKAAGVGFDWENTEDVREKMLKSYQNFKLRLRQEIRNEWKKSLEMFYFQ